MKKVCRHSQMFCGWWSNMLCNCGDYQKRLRILTTKNSHSLVSEKVSTLVWYPTVATVIMGYFNRRRIFSRPSPWLYPTPEWSGFAPSFRYINVRHKPLQYCQTRLLNHNQYTVHRDNNADAGFKRVHSFPTFQSRKQWKQHKCGPYGEDNSGQRIEMSEQISWNIQYFKSKAKVYWECFCWTQF